MWFRRFELADSNCVVTGATGGIGLAVAEKLIARGSTVLAVGRRDDRLRQNADRLGERYIPLRADLSQTESVAEIVDGVDQHFDGRLNLLVNNAGVGAIGPFAEADAARLRLLFEVDFFSAVELTRQLSPALHRSAPSMVCNIGSVLGHCAVPNKSEYCAAKFAMHGWNDALRAEWQSKNVDVILVNPSTTRSEFFDALVQTDPATKSRSIGSWSTEDVAEATIRAIERRKREVILSTGGKLLVYADRIIPSLVSRLLSRGA